MPFKDKLSSLGQSVLDNASNLDVFLSFTKRFWVPMLVAAVFGSGMWVGYKVGKPKPITPTAISPIVEVTPPDIKGDLTNQEKKVNDSINSLDPNALINDIKSRTAAERLHPRRTKNK